MTLRDLFDRIVGFIPRMMFPVYVEDHAGNLYEIERVDFRNGVAGTVFECPELDAVTAWDDDLIALKESIQAAWGGAAYDSDAHRVFDPTANVISVERAYALLEQVEKLLIEMYEPE